MAHSGALCTWQADYLLRGALVDWIAQVDTGNGTGPQLAGAIHLSRGQTRGLAPTLVAHMVGQSIDALEASL
ncbi:MAG: hypothetical protein HY855_20305 [Burkholderiales bacterium]|nr:hypothetical protein [Burkholderiales bacterium]